MRVAVFFLYLFLFLLKGGECSQTVAASYNSGYAYAQHNHIAQSIEYTTTDDVRTIYNTNRDHQNENFIMEDEVEDGDTNDSFARKFKLLDKYCSIHFCQSTAGYLINRSKSALSFYGRVSYKYILQRVLRV